MDWLHFPGNTSSLKHTSLEFLVLGFDRLLIPRIHNPVIILVLNPKQAFQRDICLHDDHQFRDGMRFFFCFLFIYIFYYSYVAIRGSRRCALNPRPDRQFTRKLSFGPLVSLFFSFIRILLILTITFRFY